MCLYSIITLHGIAIPEKLVNVAVNVIMSKYQTAIKIIIDNVMCWDAESKQVRDKMQL